MGIQVAVSYQFCGVIRPYTWSARLIPSSFSRRLKCSRETEIRHNPRRETHCSHWLKWSLWISTSGSRLREYSQRSVNDMCCPSSIPQNTPQQIVFMLADIWPSNGITHFQWLSGEANYHLGKNRTKRKAKLP